MTQPQPQEQFVNRLSIELLERLGNNEPTQEQIDLLEAILTEVTIVQRLSLSKTLTQRERNCLYWAALGKTSTETAALLNIQPSTVEQHRQEIRRKLGCKSMAAAVFKGMRFGYLHLKENKKAQVII